MCPCYALPPTCPNCPQAHLEYKHAALVAWKAPVLTASTPVVPLLGAFWIPTACIPTEPFVLVGGHCPGKGNDMQSDLGACQSVTDRK